MFSPFLMSSELFSPFTYCLPLKQPIGEITIEDKGKLCISFLYFSKIHCVNIQLLYHSLNNHCELITRKAEDCVKICSHVNTEILARMLESVVAQC